MIDQRDARGGSHAGQKLRGHRPEARLGPVDSERSTRHREQHLVRAERPGGPRESKGRKYRRTDVVPDTPTAYGIAVRTPVIVLDAPTVLTICGKKT